MASEPGSSFFLFLPAPTQPSALAQPSVVKVKGLLSLVQLLATPETSLPGSSLHVILQARILEWVAMPSPRDLSGPGIEPRYPA